MITDPDIQHMLAFQKGDVSAFRILFDRYRKKIINYCHRFCNDGDVAEELAQEVFLRVYKAAPKYRPDARFSTWIFKIATNICLNELRKSRYHFRTESIDAPTLGKDGEGTSDIEDLTQPRPNEAVQSREKDRIIREAISELPPKQRAALLLRVFHDFSYEEISKQIGRSPASVKSLIHRGRQNLKKSLHAYMRGDT